MIKLRGAYYFGVEGKCNFFVAEGIVEAFGIGSMAPDSTVARTGVVAYRVPFYPP
jgi:hypothetical protein